MELNLNLTPEEQQKALAAELSHRVKNSLAVVSSIAERTLEEGESKNHFVSRLHALWPESAVRIVRGEQPGPDRRSAEGQRPRPSTRRGYRHDRDRLGELSNVSSP